MARYDDGHRILAIGRTHRTHRFGVIDAGCNVPVAGDLPIGNLLQGLPDLLLKIRTLHIQGHRKALSGTCQIFLQLFGTSDCVLIGLISMLWLTKINTADALISRGDGDRAEVRIDGLEISHHCCHI